ncbi:MAG: hypothetical protein ACTSSI_10975 [Candidatus Helarchaeota archaeon]
MHRKLIVVEEKPMLFIFKIVPERFQAQFLRSRVIPLRIKHEGESTNALLKNFSTIFGIRMEFLQLFIIYVPTKR